MMFTRRNWWWPAALLFFGASAARAHDSLQSSTNIWLTPGQIEVELILARAPARQLIDHPPPTPVADENFESAYHALFQKSAPGLLEVTLDGQKITPGSITIGLYQETDLRFDYLFPYPPHGRLGFTALFLKRMADGYYNTLSVDEGDNVLSYTDQDVDHPTFAIDLGAGLGAPAPAAPTPASATPAKPPETPPAQISHLQMYAGLALAFGLFAAWNAWRFAQKSRRKT